MRFFYRYFLAFSYLLMSCVAYAEPVAWDGPGAAGWLTKTSPHFDVHFPKSEQFSLLADRALALAEQAHDDLMPFFGSAPKEKTQLVITDDLDIANGWATFFPFPQIRLYSYPASDVLGLNNFEDWWRMLIRHEYVHILHTELSRGLPEKGQHVFGRLPIFFPHAFSPPMMLEGLAVYFETDYERGTGRLMSSWYQLQMQEEVRSGRFASFNEAVLPTRDWPYGNHYLYGAFFVEYLMNVYGEDRFALFLQNYSDEIIPWFLQDKVARNTFGKSFGQLWTDFEKTMVRRFGPVDSVAKEAAMLYAGDDGVRQQLAISQDSYLYRVVINDLDRPVLQRCGSDGHCDDIANGENIVSLAIDDTETLVAARQIAYTSGRLSADLYLLQDGDWRRLTTDQRVSQVVSLPSTAQQTLSSQWLIRTQRAGVSSLMTVNNKGNTSTLIALPMGDVIADVAIEPSGAGLMAVVKRGYGYWDIERLDLSSLKWQRITNDRAIESGLKFDDEGRLLFSADKDGTFNIMSLESGRTKQLTNTQTGNFTPQIVAGHLMYQVYTAEGFYWAMAADSLTANPDDLGSLMAESYSTISDNTADEKAEQHERLMSTLEPPVSSLEATEYSPWSTLRPRYWLPLFALLPNDTQLGATTSGSDALQRHNYLVSVLYHNRGQVVDLTLIYNYERWYFGYQHSYDWVNFNGADNDDTRFVSDDLYVQRLHLWRGWQDRLGLHAGTLYEHKQVDELEEGVTVVGDSGVTIGRAGLALTLGDLGYALLSPGPSFGYRAHWVVENFNLPSSDAEGWHVQGEAGYTFDLPKSQSISLEIAAGYASENAPFWTLGGLPPRDDDSLFGRDDLSLRGYEDSQFYGRYYHRERLTYRSIVSRIQRNWYLWPLGVDDIGINLYAEQGATWLDDETVENYPALGAELSVNLVLGYRLPAPLVLGAVSGLDNEYGQNQFYLRLGVPL
ncbi:MAG: hypothetical protein P1U57_03720 [Oleibacter sp.]|nr:hypothetical protein [Thalassolituus sp.]